MSKISLIAGVIDSLSPGEAQRIGRGDCYPITFTIAGKFGSRANLTLEITKGQTALINKLIDAFNSDGEIELTISTKTARGE